MNKHLDVLFSRFHQLYACKNDILRAYEILAEIPDCEQRLQGKMKTV